MNFALPEIWVLDDAQFANAKAILADLGSENMD
jgi:hypothetical protein